MSEEKTKILQVEIMESTWWEYHYAVPEDVNIEEFAEEIEIYDPTYSGPVKNACPQTMDIKQSEGWPTIEVYDDATKQDRKLLWDNGAIRKLKIVKGDLIKLALEGEFDVIAHGCNCFCRQGAGLAFQMVKYFQTDNPYYYPSEANRKENIGNFNKLGNIEYAHYITDESEEYVGIMLQCNHHMHTSLDHVTIVNCYTQYYHNGNNPDKSNPPLNYAALELCLTKINHTFKGKKVGLPWIGCGLAGGDHKRVAEIISRVMTDVDVTIVEYEK